MSQKLLDVQEEVTTGVHPELPQDRIPFWEKTSNLIYDNMGVQAAPGHFLLFDKLDSDAKLGLIEAEILCDTVRKKTLFSGSQSRLFRYLSPDTLESDVSRAVGGAYGVGAEVHQTINAPALAWSFLDWGEWVLATNGWDKLQLYKGNIAAPQKFADLVQADSSPLPFSWAQIIRRVKVYAVALNTSNGTDLAEWCDADDLFTWTETTTNEAGQLPIRDLNSQIMAAEDLGTAGLGVYGRDQLHLLEFIGAPDVLGFRKLQSGIGAFGKMAVTSVGVYHYGWGPRGIWRTDGNQVEYIDNPSIREMLKKTLNKEQASRIVAWPLVNYNGVCFFYPTIGQLWPDAGIFFSWDNGTWWELAFGRTAGTRGSVFDLPFTSDKIGNIFQVSEFGSLSASLQGPLTLLGDAEYYGGFGFAGFGDLGFSSTVLQEA